MADDISSISSYSNDYSTYLDKKPTLFDKIEQKTLKNKTTDINTLKDNLKDKKTSKNTFFKTYEGKVEKGCTDFTSKTYSNFVKMNSIEIKDNSFHDINDLQGNLFEYPPFLFGPQENKADELFKLDDFIVNANKKTNEIKLTCKKRKLDTKNIIQTKEDIFDEIKKLFNKFNNKKYNKINEILPSYKIFEESDDIFKHATIVENKIPGCVIYFKNDIITNIYLIREQEFLKEEKEILDLLNIIKSSISKNSFL